MLHWVKMSLFSAKHKNLPKQCYLPETVWADVFNLFLYFCLLSFFCISGAPGGGSGKNSLWEILQAVYFHFHLSKRGKPFSIFSCTIFPEWKTDQQNYCTFRIGHLVREKKVKAQVGRLISSLWWWQSTRTVTLV